MKKNKTRHNRRGTERERKRKTNAEVEKEKEKGIIYSRNFCLRLGCDYLKKIATKKNQM